MGDLFIDLQRWDGRHLYPPFTVEPERPSQSMELDKQGISQADVDRI